MPAGITLTFGADVAQRIEATWQALAQAGHGESMPRLGYVPHLTLAVWPEADPPGLAAVAHLVPPWITLAGLGIFPGESAVLWLGVVATPELLALHRAVLNAVPAPPHPHYAAGAWMPHVTLAIGLPAGTLPAATAVAAGRYAPMLAAVATIEAVTFPPVAVTARVAVPAAA